jgi:hypothetical protein
MDKNKKAQMQITETIFAVIIILVIIVICLVFYAKARESTINEQGREAKIIRIISLAHTISSWPEIDCSVRETREFDCLDTTKLEILSNIINASRGNNDYTFNYYYDLLRSSTIFVKQLYPSSSEWLVYDNPGATKNVDTVTIPMSLYDPIRKQYAFGIMELKVYE